MTYHHPRLSDLERASESETPDAAVAAHLQACPACRATLASVKGEAVSTDAYIEVESKAAPQPPRELQVGQVWRLEWDSETAFGMIRDHDESGVEILPVVEDPDLIKDAWLKWSRDESPVGFSAALWAGPNVRIRRFVLDQYYDTIELPRLLPEPKVPVAYSDAADALIRETSWTLDFLASQDWVPPNAGIDWDTILEKSEVSYEELAKELDLSLPRVLELRQGMDELPPDKLELAAAVLRIDVSEVPGPPPIRPALVWALDQPVRRASIRIKALEWGEDEAGTRRRIAQEVAAPRYRNAGDRDSREFWEQAVDDYFNRQ